MSYLIRESVKDDSYGIMHAVTLAWNETYKDIVPDEFLKMADNDEIVKSVYNRYEIIKDKLKKDW